MKEELLAYRVISSSMMPVLCKGQLIFLTQTPFGDLKIGDIVGLKVGQCLYVHRIANIQADGLSYGIKGDNNNFADNVLLDCYNYIGKVKYSVKDMKLVSIETGKEYDIQKNDINGNIMYVCSVESHKLIFNDEMCACL